MNDYDVAIAGHFLGRAAASLQHPSAHSLSRWHYEGPGVWTGIDEATLSGSSELFPVAIKFISDFGDSIPVSYLQTHLNFTEIKWLKDQSTSNVISCIQRLRDFVAQDTEQDAAANP